MIPEPGSAPQEAPASAASREYWDALYAGRENRYSDEGVLFRDVFDRFLPSGGSCFEVGCYPGDFLIYLSRRFGYTVSGIDTTPFVEDRMRPYLEHNGAQVGRLIRGDFLTFEPPERYDVVCSFGFIEHFYDFERIIERHLDLLRPGGTLVLSCPNFRKLQFLLHWTFDRKNLRRHVLRAMDLAAWRGVLERRGLEVLHSGYWRTAAFWVEDPQPTRAHWRTVGWIARNLERLDRRVARPNRWLSPFLITVARSRGGADRGR